MRKVVLTLLLLFVSTPVFSQESVIARLPKAGNTLSILNSRMKQYLVLLKEQTQVTDLENGCLRLKKEVYFPQYRENIFRLCAFVKEIAENKVYEELKIFKDNELLQTFTFIQEGDGIKSETLDSIQKLIFRVKGKKGIFRASGLTDIEFNYQKEDDSESFHLYFSPVDFRLDVFHIVQENIMERIRYDISCSFCQGIEWVEVREFYREGQPLDVRYYDSENPTDVTPRRFDEMLGALYYRSMGQLGAAIQSTLVLEGGLPEIRF